MDKMNNVFKNWLKMKDNYWEFIIVQILYYIYKINPQQVREYESISNTTGRTNDFHFQFVLKNGGLY